MKIMKINNNTIEFTLPSSFVLSNIHQNKQLLINEESIFQKSKAFFGNFINKASKPSSEVIEPVQNVENNGFQAQDIFKAPVSNDNSVVENIKPIEVMPNPTINSTPSPAPINTFFQPVEVVPVSIEMPSVSTTEIFEPTQVTTVAAQSTDTENKVTLEQYFDALETIKVYSKQQAEDFIALQTQLSVVKGTAEAYREAIGGIASAVKNPVEPALLNQEMQSMQRVIE